MVNCDYKLEAHSHCRLSKVKYFRRQQHEGITRLINSHFLPFTDFGLFGGSGHGVAEVGGIRNDGFEIEICGIGIEVGNFGNETDGIGIPSD